MTDSPVHKTKEHRLIESIKSWTGEHLIGDDCAILPGRGLVTADSLVEGTHFLLPGIKYEDLGWKSVAVNLSDVAAMAGRPRFAIVSLTLPDSVSEADFEKLYRGMLDCARTYRCRIVGGDLTKGPVLVVSITVIGDEHENGVIRRSGALEGDVVVVTGDFGASAAGLWLIQHQQLAKSHCLSKHFRPLPRLCEAWALVRKTSGRAAMMDASDGLADALVQISAASKVGMTIEAEKIPIHSETRAVAARANQSYLEWALYGGEDYELVACLSPEDWQAISAHEANPFTVIGKVSKQPGQVVLKTQNGELERIDLKRAFQHWK